MAPTVSTDLPMDSHQQQSDHRQPQGQQPNNHQGQQKYHTVFDTSPGHTEVVEHHISTGDSKPVFHPPYRVPSAWQESVREEIEDMLRAGIIVPSRSPWKSPIVHVKKKDGSL